jgi:endonuclease-3 related protein
MVGAVLTQNAAWTNVEKAIANLRRERALSLARVLALPRARLQRLIRPAGYFRVKAKRLRSVCEWLAARCGARCNLRKLESEPTPDLRRELLGVHGVGPETADSILLYALGREVFVVDAYTRRVLSRHGMSEAREGYESLRERFERAIAGRNRLSRLNELHAQVVELAKRHCRPRPRCEGCPLEGWPQRSGARPATRRG